ncbi:MAG: DUF2024 family protein [Ignavibacteriaceae bacterium]|nr:DUF2024 family protein [Ignavibacteriaceae bacterium]
MKAAVWDSYIKKDNGNILHFDVVVPESRSESAIDYKYAYEYLKSKGVNSAEINVTNCQFCHIEILTEKMMSDIESKGFYIIEMDEIASELPDNPTRREMILFLRAHYDEYRYANFRNKSDNQIMQIIQELNIPKML